MAYTKARPGGWQDTTLPDKFKDALDTIEGGISAALPKDGSEAMAGDLKMGENATDTHKVVNVKDPTDNQDAATKHYVDSQDDTKVNKAGDTMSGNLDMNGNQVIGLPEIPSSRQEAASKAYVDSIANHAESELRAHESYADMTFLKLSGGGEMQGPIDMAGHNIMMLGDPTHDHDAVAKWYVDAAEANAKYVADQTYVKKSGDTMSGELNMGGNGQAHKIVNVKTPENDGDAANKGYVDSESGKLQDQLNDVADDIMGLSSSLSNSRLLGQEIYVTDPAGAYRKGDRISAETTIAAALYNMLCRPQNPTILRNPSVSISVVDPNGDTSLIETGTDCSLYWSVMLDPGAYTFKSQTQQTDAETGESEYVAVDGTGVSVNSLTVTVDEEIICHFDRTVEAEADLISLADQMDVEIGYRVYCLREDTVYQYMGPDPSDAACWETADVEVMADSYELSEPLSDTGVKFSVSLGHTQGNVALTNIETVPSPEDRVQIAANTVTAEYTLKGYRKMFYGAVSERSDGTSIIRDEITSDVIRGLEGRVPDKAAHTFMAPAGSTKVVIAAPSAYTTNKPKVEMLTLSWEDYSEFFVEIEGGVQVADARGGANGLAPYTVYVYEFNAISADTQFQVTLK